MMVRAMFGSRPGIRAPVAAGRFYEADGRRCARQAAELCAHVESAAVPEALCGALVPHAGWIYSGRTAGIAFAALAEHTNARTFVLLGAVHTVDLKQPALDTAEAWSTPMGEVAVDAQLREEVAQLTDYSVRDEAHRFEHSLEVQLPLMQTLFGDQLRIVPCLVPPRPEAPEWGRALGELLRRRAEATAIIASSDLTHYGPSYGFFPHGAGRAGTRWARETNDRQLLDLIERLDADAVLAHALAHQSACGGGAIAAAISACRIMGAKRGYILQHTDSAQVAAGQIWGETANSVGYAAVVFG
jgi:AmmeMemoRadiSam system protein B